MRSLSELERDNEALRQELAATLDALVDARAVPDRDEVVSFIVKVPAQNGWHRWTKATYRSQAEAGSAAAVAAENHSRARVVERRSFIRERVVFTLPASGMEARQGRDGATRLHRNDDSPAAESGDAQRRSD